VIAHGINTINWECKISLPLLTSSAVLTATGLDADGSIVGNQISDSKMRRVALILDKLCAFFPSRAAAKLTPPPLPVHHEVPGSRFLSLAK